MSKPLRTTLSPALPIMTMIAVLTMAADGPDDTARFSEITVQRINIVSPDGTLRLAISNSELQAVTVIDGEELQPNRERPAGLIFFNEKGDECGGLVFNGDPASNGGGFFFDQYRQDQAIGLVHEEQSVGTRRQRQSALKVWDRPSRSIWEMEELTRELLAIPDAAARERRIAELEGEGVGSAERLYAGRDPGGNAVVKLRDSHGRPRLQLTVTEAGAASIEFLDAEGNVVKVVDGD